MAGSLAATFSVTGGQHSPCFGPEYQVQAGPPRWAWSQAACTPAPSRKTQLLAPGLVSALRVGPAGAPRAGR